MNNRIYIAGKITGDEDYKAKFKYAESTIARARKGCKGMSSICHLCPFYDRRYVTRCRLNGGNWNLEIVNPAEFDLDGRKFWQCMVKCLWELRKCHYVFFLRDWKDSRGARMEHKWAMRWNKDIIYQK